MRAQAVVPSALKSDTPKQFRVDRTGEPLAAQPGALAGPIDLQKCSAVAVAEFGPQRPSGRAFASGGRSAAAVDDSHPQASAFVNQVMVNENGSRSVTGWGDCLYPAGPVR
jgi:hypothetical protein